MPYKIKKQKCKQSDGDSGSYVLSYTSTKGKKYNNCHTSKKKAQGQIAAIEGPSEMDETDDMVFGGGGDPEAEGEEDEGGMDEALIREYIREKLLFKMRMLTEAEEKIKEFGSDQRGRLAEYVTVIAHNGFDAASVLSAMGDKPSDDKIQAASDAIKAGIQADSSFGDAKTKSSAISALETMTAVAKDNPVDSFDRVRGAIQDGISMKDHIANTTDFTPGDYNATHTGVGDQADIGVSDVVLLKKDDETDRIGLSLKIGSSNETQMNSSASNLSGGDASSPFHKSGMGNAEKFISNILSVVGAALQGDTLQGMIPAERAASGAVSVGASEYRSILEKLVKEQTPESIVDDPANLGTVNLATTARASTIKDASGEKTLAGKGADKGAQEITGLVNLAAAQFWKSQLSPQAVENILRAYYAHFEETGMGDKIWALKPSGLHRITGAVESNPRNNFINLMGTGANKNPDFNREQDIGVKVMDNSIEIYDMKNKKYLMSVRFREKSRVDVMMGKNQGGYPESDLIRMVDYKDRAFNIPMTSDAIALMAFSGEGGADLKSKMLELYGLLTGKTPSRQKKKSVGKIFSAVRTSLECMDGPAQAQEIWNIISPGVPLPEMAGESHGTAAADLSPEETAALEEAAVMQQAQNAIKNWFSAAFAAAGESNVPSLEFDDACDKVLTKIEALGQTEDNQRYQSQIAPELQDIILKKYNERMKSEDPNFTPLTSFGTQSDPAIPITQLDGTVTNRFYKPQNAIMLNQLSSLDLKDTWEAASRALLAILSPDGQATAEEQKAMELLYVQGRGTIISGLSMIAEWYKLQVAAAEMLEDQSEKQAAISAANDKRVELVKIVLNVGGRAAPVIAPEALSQLDSVLRESVRKRSVIITEKNIRLMIHQRLTEELTRADKTEIARIFKKEMSKVDARKAIRKEIESSKTQTMIDKAFKKQFDKELRKALGVSFFGTPGKINKFVVDEIQKEVEKILGDAATKELVVQICKDVIIKLYRELSFTYKPVIQRLKV